MLVPKFISGQFLKTKTGFVSVYHINTITSNDLRWSKNIAYTSFL